MRKPSKVVPITLPDTEEKPNVIARDLTTRRLIVAIGSRRFAVDFFTRITNLPPHTGDQPGRILSLHVLAAMRHNRGPETSEQLEAKKPRQPQSPRRRKKNRSPKIISRR
jgi:hypothetical protein